LVLSVWLREPGWLGGRDGWYELVQVGRESRLAYSTWGLFYLELVYLEVVNRELIA